MTLFPIVVFDIETTGLDVTDDFTCIGVMPPEGIIQFGGVNHVRAFNSFLDWFNAYSTANPDAVWVSFNGKGFDIPRLALRARKLGREQEALKLEELNRSTRHVDLMLKLGSNKRAQRAFPASGSPTGRYSKSAVLRGLSIYEPRSIDGRTCAILGEACLSGRRPESDLSDIYQHNATDLVSTLKLYLRFEKEGWLA